MRYSEFKDQFKDYIVFSLADIKKINPRFYRNRLNDWQKKGYIKKLRRGFYMFADTNLNENALFLIANLIYSPSYVSLESALTRYGLIPEGVYTITSVSTAKTAKFKTPVAEFTYRRVKPSLMFGYRLEKYGNRNYRIAEIEKTVLDYLYVNPRIIKEEDFFEWRFDSSEFLVKADLEKMRRYCAEFKNNNFTKRCEKFLELVKQSH
ncbi:MAG: hypothetical protein WCX69_04300 [Candidatus Paceibacterota bacterium]